uniref:Uncharacterized protein n=1 Tax=Haptolina brevifila TaxID=156173 RepID=A0A7S2J909_9EUKA|mmetsp:Transcript_78136/g.155274  ORF Transcript_78136/g.155274 Transcript_78136/m.155274 type:complete len:142 (+) Transcript_78136:65-490(+)|eukprot:CAMPEP_0174716986 /NCGR_PEP_ID=MMETSP1094-20130205/25520_1 /TAXON_ID=156173 /ORGANISM="Chrysochromulina brevifilum, Strain UTEX LB 985" /LENGTH=141 /DNA_ID=CAMNT_0015916859 /DNA_START=56 /DNA_END=481 /DNA_ORIENTATION=+
MTTVAVVSTGPYVSADAVDENDLHIVSACCCSASALYLDCPACIGCSGKGSLCCLEIDTCCKFGAPCLCCGPCGCKCISPTTCVKFQKQCCCFVNNCAFPCDEEMPAMLACCCLACYPKCGCCRKQGDLTGKPITLIIVRE